MHQAGWAYIKRELWALSVKQKERFVGEVRVHMSTCRREEEDEEEESTQAFDPALQWAPMSGSTRKGR